MAKVIYTQRPFPSVVYVADRPVHFDSQGVAEVDDPEQLAILREVEKVSGQVRVEEDKEDVKEEAEVKEEASKKRGRKKAEE